MASGNGFLSVLKRLIVGQPAFVDTPSQTAPEHREINAWIDQPISDGSDAPVDQLPPLPRHDRFHDDHGQKLHPVVRIEHCETKLHTPGRMDIWVLVRNESEFNLEIDRFELLGNRRDMNQYLSPGQQRQLLIYSGSMPHDTRDTTARLCYKIVDNGDMFLAQYHVRYESEDTGYFSVAALDLMSPIRDA